MRQRFVHVTEQPRMQRLMLAVEDAIRHEGEEEIAEESGDE